MEDEALLVDAGDGLALVTGSLPAPVCSAPQSNRAPRVTPDVIAPLQS